MKFKGDDMKNLINARRIAETHNMFVVQRTDVFLLYRRLPHQERDTRLGSAKTTKALLTLVERCATTSKEHHA
jgi:hypothetical protein